MSTIAEACARKNASRSRTKLFSFGTVATARFVMLGMQSGTNEQRQSCKYLYPKLVAGLVEGHQGRLAETGSRIVKFYWAPSCIAGAMLMEQTKKFLGMSMRPVKTVHAVCNPTEPAAARKLSVELDRLSQEANRLLPRQTQNLAIDGIYAAYTVILQEIDEHARRNARSERTPRGRRGTARSGQPSRKRAAENIAILNGLVGDLRTYIHSEALRRAEHFYLLGTLVGFFGLAVIATLLTTFIPKSHLGGLEVITFIGPLLAGGLGALFSIMLRMSNGSLNVEWEAGVGTVLLIGFLRPLIGAVSAGVVYLFVKTGLVSLVGSATSQSDAFFLAVGFIAGFGERWVRSDPSWR